MKRETPSSAVRSLIKLLWRAPLIAIPMTAFIWFRDSGKANEFIRYYLPTVFFTVSGWFGLWVVQWFVLPRFVHPDADDGRATLLRALFFSIGTLTGFGLAVLTLALTIAPGLISDPRQAAIIGVYGLVFSLISIGVGFTAAFYRRGQARTRTEHELRLARRIQSSFLPTQFPHIPTLDVSARNVPSKEVSGDFYDVVPVSESAILFAIADVSGKGVPAALLSSMLQASLRTQALSTPSVATILRNINTLIYRSTSMGQFATFFLGRFDPGTRVLCYTNAGHNPPVLFRRGAERVALERGGPVLGVLEAVEYEEGSVTLAPGDRLLLYSDGLTEASGASGELFGEDRLMALVESSPPSLACADLTTSLLEAVQRFAGAGEPEDDMTLVMFRVLEGPGA